MLTNEDLNVIEKVLADSPSAELAKSITAHINALDYAITQNIRNAEKMLAAVQTVAEDFRKFKNSFMIAGGVVLTAPAIGEETFSKGRAARTNKKNRKPRTRETYAKPPKSETRTKQIEAVKALWREHMAKGAKRDEYGLLRGTCKDVFTSWEGTDQPGYDGYPSYDALYNYCQTHKIWKEG